jgi:hypothetical protein
MVDFDEIVEADDELAEDEWEAGVLEELDPLDLVEPHLAGVPFN